MFEKSWQIKTHGTRTRVRLGCLEAGMGKHSRWNMTESGLFKHPLRAIERADESLPCVYHARLRFEVDGSPTPSPPARWQAFVQKCTSVDGGLGAVIVPVGLAFVVITIVVVVIAVMISIMLTCKLARSVANAPNARASTSVKLGC